jgi:hypothetical protein
MSFSATLYALAASPIHLSSDAMYLLLNEGMHEKLVII